MEVHPELADIFERAGIIDSEQADRLRWELAVESDRMWDRPPGTGLAETRYAHLRPRETAESD